MKLYKFRGKDRHDGTMRYGSLTQEFRNFGGESVIWCFITEYAGNTRLEQTYRVENESVAQLIGYDNTGAEVYEGDDLSDIAKFI